MSITIDDFSTDAVPTDDEVPSFLKDSDEPTCKVCGKEIGYLYSGRGRKPTACEDHKRGSGAKSGATRTRANGDVDQAVAALEGAYQMVSFGLMLFAPEAAKLMSDSIPDLNAKNRTLLANDKELVRAINKVGKVGGRFAFFAAQAMTLGPVAVLAVSEIRENFSEATTE